LKSLFLVDDSEFLRSMMKELLIGQNFKVVGEAEDIQGALDGVKKTSPDLVLLDIRLNASSGLDLIEVIKKEKKNTKIIVCSAVNKQEVIKDAIMRGADNYITKPFLCKNLFEMLNNA